MPASIWPAWTWALSGLKAASEPLIQCPWMRSSEIPVLFAYLSFNLYHILGTTVYGDWKFLSFALNLPEENQTDNVDIYWDWVGNTRFPVLIFYIFQFSCTTESWPFFFPGWRLCTVLIWKLLIHCSLPFLPFLYSSDSKVCLWNRVNRGATDSEYHGFSVFS